MTDEISQTKQIKLLKLILLTTLLYGCGSEESQITKDQCDNSSLAGSIIKIPAGKFTMGDDRYYREETPRQKMTIKSFWIDRTEVTNAQFAEFVDQTHYVTAVEKGFDIEHFPNIEAEFRAPGSMVFSMPNVTEGESPINWWRFVAGANWRHPYGPKSSIEGKENNPVVQITYQDAIAYANWRGHRLPTEAEWEYAALGGNNTSNNTEDKKQPATTEANFWQGLFPLFNTHEDGYEGIAPVGCFTSNGYGLYDMIGNVWELTASKYYPGHNINNQYINSHPNGLDPKQPNMPVHVIKGGSYLCAENYCQRYRPAARQAQDVFLASSHLGFRTVKSIEMVD